MASSSSSFSPWPESAEYVRFTSYTEKTFHQEFAWITVGMGPLGSQEKNVIHLDLDRIAELRYKKILLDNFVFFQLIMDSPESCNVPTRNTFVKISDPCTHGLSEDRVQRKLRQLVNRALVELPEWGLQNCTAEFVSEDGRVFTGNDGLTKFHQAKIRVGVNYQQVLNAERLKREFNEEFLRRQQQQASASEPASLT
jgi:hypothetical protein